LIFEYFFQKSPWFKHVEFWISVFQYTEIKKSSCIETWRFCKAKLFIFSNLHASIHGDSKSPYIIHRNFLIIMFQYTDIFKNIRVLKHGDSKTSVFYARRFVLKRPITRWNRNRLWKYFRVWIRVLGTTNLWKNRVQKSHATVPLNKIFIEIHRIISNI